MSIYIPNGANVINSPWVAPATQNVTAMCWVYFPGAVSGFPRSIVHFQTTSTSGLALSTTNGAQTINFGAANQGNTGPGFSYGAWYHLTESIRALTTTNYFVRGYVNGQMQLYVNGTGTLGPITSVSLGNNTQSGPANANPLVGNIRDFRMFTRELSPSEVQAEYNSSVPVNREGLKFWNRLDDRLATTFTDDLGNTWTTTGTVTLQNGGPRKAWPARRKNYLI